MPRVPIYGHARNKCAKTNQARFARETPFRFSGGSMPLPIRRVLLCFEPDSRKPNIPNKTFAPGCVLRGIKERLRLDNQRRIPAYTSDDKRVCLLAYARHDDGATNESATRRFGFATKTSQMDRLARLGRRRRAALRVQRPGRSRNSRTPRPSRFRSRTRKVTPSVYPTSAAMVSMSVRLVRKRCTARSTRRS